MYIKSSSATFDSVRVRDGGSELKTRDKLTAGLAIKLLSAYSLCLRNFVSCNLHPQVEEPCLWTILRRVMCQQINHEQSNAPNIKSFGGHYS